MGFVGGGGGRCGGLRREFFFSFSLFFSLSLSLSLSLFGLFSCFVCGFVTFLFADFFLGLDGMSWGLSGRGWG